MRPGLVHLGVCGTQGKEINGTWTCLECELLLEGPLFWTPNFKDFRDPQCSFPHVSSSQKVLERVFVSSQVECLPPQVPFCWLPKGRHATGLTQLFKTLLQFSDEDFQRMFLSGANSQRFCPQHSVLTCLPQCPPSNHCLNPH